MFVYLSDKIIPLKSILCVSASNPCVVSIKERNRHGERGTISTRDSFTEVMAAIQKAEAKRFRV